MNDLHFISMIRDFPVGGIPKNRDEILSKAEIISFLSRFQEQFSSIEDIDEREETVKSFLCEVLKVSAGEKIPSLEQAERTLKLSNGFVTDYSKIEYIKEINPEFDECYNSISRGLGLGQNVSKER